MFPPTTHDSRAPDGLRNYRGAREGRRGQDRACGDRGPNRHSHFPAAEPRGISGSPRTHCLLHKPTSPEILSLIFIFTLPAPNHTKASSVQSESPWLVGQVCSFWREISLSCRSLWASPIICHYSIMSVAQFDLQLARSGNTPLHPRVCGPPQSVFRLDLLKSLVKFSDRWASLFLSFNWPAVQPQLASLKGNVRRLEELHIVGAWGDGSAALSEGDRLKAFAIAPRLRTLSIVNICEPAVSLLLPWHQLTQYRAISGAHEHLAVLKLCPNLVNAHLVFRTTLTVTDNAPVSVRLPQLRKLHLANAESLRIMSLPVLEDIVLDQMVPENDALLPLLSLTRRDNPPLSSISLFNGALVGPTLITILEENPSISTLRIHIRRADIAAVDALFLRLTIGATHTECFAPNLVSLELGGRGAFGQERFLHMVQSRRRKQGSVPATCECESIQRISLRMTQKAALSSETVQGLGALAQGGMHLSMTTFSFFSDNFADPYE
ncbi:hypothetical protein DFH07DRAFT_850440 [Mycena maculata]|uniref:F-box domain-containing protein n=1 Tax=Mycena maculata TaxID=230809 RepID=A0AAD7HVC2_9AGAR|nr:hypothetical protein DFH07DRAFT_850440 [Mycena maculata]